jgi:hypothetical protein
MGKASAKSVRRSLDRDSGGFVALPWSVLDSASYARLGHPARALLLELARQYVRDNNGRLLLSYAYMTKRGWKSADVITRAKRDLLTGGFIHETVKGHRPNKASWYAVTWHPIDRLPGYDPGGMESFERSAYLHRGGNQNASLRPSDGVGRAPIAPSRGLESSPSTPPHGAISPVYAGRSTPPHGNHLEMPSTGRQLKDWKACTMNETIPGGHRPNSTEQLGMVVRA